MMFWRAYLLPHVSKLGPAWIRRAIVDLIPSQDLHNVRDKVDTIWATSQEIYAQKRAALSSGDEAVKQQIGLGKDILSLLSMFPLVAQPMFDADGPTVRANMKTDDPLDETELLGQMS